MNSMAILENVRRYRTIASLYRQTAAFRPLHSGSLLAQARDWEHRAVAELEAYYEAFCSAASGNTPVHSASCAAWADGGRSGKGAREFIKNCGGVG
jgi:hypothetical protein